MGQKTPSVALRLGLHRKWSTSWFPVEFTSSGSSPALSSASLAKASTFATSPFLRLSPHTVPRGGQSRSGREERLFSFFCRRPFIFSSPARPSFGTASSTFPQSLPSFLTLTSVGSSADSQVSSSSVRPSSRRRSSGLSSTPLSSPHRFYPIDLHIRVGSGGQLFIFFVYAKLLGRSKTALS